MMPPTRRRHAAATVLACTLALVTARCGASRPHTDVHWPGSAHVTLERALRVTAAVHALPTPVLPDGSAAAPIVPEPLPLDVGGVHARSAVFEGLWYAEVVVGDVSPDEPLPLVVALHGRGDMPRLPGGPFRRTPTPMRVIIPRGPLSLGAGYAWARYSVSQNRPDELAADLRAAADRIAGLIEHVRAIRPTAGTPIITGFSQGAILGWVVAITHPESVGLALLVAAWLPPHVMPTEITPLAARVRAMHGTADSIVPVAGTRDVAIALRTLGYDVELSELLDVGHLVTPEMNQRFELWLEDALAERSPDREHGLGGEGLDPGVYETYAPPLFDDTSDVAVLAPLPESPTSGADAAAGEP